MVHFMMAYGQRRVNRVTKSLKHSNNILTHRQGAETSKSPPSGCIWMLHEQICQPSHSLLLHVPFCNSELTIPANIIFFQICKQKQLKFNYVIFQTLIKQSACFHTQSIPEDRTRLKEQCRQALVPQHLISGFICYLPSGEKDVISK